MSTTGKYKMGTMARLSRFSPAVLRAWEKRYGLLKPERGSGGHRLYTERDLHVLRRVRELIGKGHSIGEIALAGPDTLAAEAPGKDSAPGSSPEPGLNGAATAHTAPELEGHRGEIVEAAVAIDGARIQRALDTAFSLVAPEIVVSQVLEPAAREIGELWASGRCSVAGEHLASHAFISRLHRLIEALNSAHPPDRPQVLCACLPGEHHEVGTLVLAYYLARMGLGVAYLGADLPLADLETAITRLEARSAYLSVTRPAVLNAQKEQLVDLVRRRSGDAVFLIGGRGVTGNEDDLRDAGARLWPEARPVWELEAEGLRTTLPAPPSPPG